MKIVKMVAGIIIGGLFFMVAWPVLRAVNAYGVADTNFDLVGQCINANAAADAWAGLGAAQWSAEWRERAASECPMARLRAERLGIDRD